MDQRIVVHNTVPVIDDEKIDVRQFNVTRLVKTPTSTFQTLDDWSLGSPERDECALMHTNIHQRR